jgi:serine/threonine protein kinase
MLYGACLCDEPSDMAIIMELVDGVTLDSLCEVSPVPKPVLNFFEPGVAAAVQAGSSRRVGDDERQGFVHEVCSALAYLHALRPVCIHGDVKPANVMVERLQNRFRTKLIDFGLARNMTADAMPLGGSWTWTAPEVLLGYDKPQTATDVFSFGRLVFFVVTGERPLKNSKLETMMREMQETSRLPGVDWPETCKLSDTYRDLVAGCCSWVSVSRPSMTDVALSLRVAGKGHAGDEMSSLAGMLQHARILQGGGSGPAPSGEPNSISSRFRGGMDHSMI